MEAIESGDESGVKRCLDDGADAMFADDEGFTALHMACQEGYQDIVTMLLRKGAKVDSTDDDGVTPLMVASEAGHESVVTLLVAENADVNLADKAGKTAILRAVHVRVLGDQERHDGLVARFGQIGRASCRERV